ncbi:MAG: hypothetical protein V4557_07390 [Bacteroidota bacterium]
MNMNAFTESLSKDSPPEKLTPALTALWYDAKGDWSAAHDLINDMSGKDEAWVHAYLHRKEGDIGNAGYWYRRAGKELCNLSLQEEWNKITEALLRND